MDFRPQLLNRFTSRFLNRIGHAEQPGKATINRHHHHRLAFASQFISLFTQLCIIGDAELLQAFEAVAGDADRPAPLAYRALLVEHDCIEQFGPDRCMFESNFPVDKVSYSYNVIYNAFTQVPIAGSLFVRTAEPDVVVTGKGLGGGLYPIAATEICSHST